MEVEIAPITANVDVLKLYHKQKMEFHFQQKSDNEFLIFLLDVAMKVITFVDQLKPNLLDACSDDIHDNSDHNSSADLDIDNENERVADARSLERPSKIAKQTVGGISNQLKNMEDNTSFQRQSEILQRQHDIVRSQNESFQFPGLPDTVVKPTFISKEASRRCKVKSSTQSSPISNMSDNEKVMDTEESTPGTELDKIKVESHDNTPSTPSTPLTRELLSRQDVNAFLPTSVSRHLPIPTADRHHSTDLHNLSPSKLRDYGVILDPKAPRVIEMSTKLGGSTIPSMAYMFSDKLTTTGENTNDNEGSRTHHNIGTLQWASEYKFDGAALHIMNGRNSRKPRTVFTWEQLKQMEETFKQKKYLCTEDRMILAQKLDLTDEQIKVWFQNRRQKWKKGGAKDDEPMDYSQYYDIFTRDGQHSQQEAERDENRALNIPEHLRLKAEQLQCLASLQQQQEQHRQAARMKSDDKGPTDEAATLLRKQQLRIAADESRSPSRTSSREDPTD